MEIIGICEMRLNVLSSVVHLSQVANVSSEGERSENSVVPFFLLDGQLSSGRMSS